MHRSAARDAGHVVGSCGSLRAPPSGADAAIGGAVPNATLGGIAGAPARNMPFAGALIGFAVLSHSLRPAVAGSARGARALAHEVRTALGARYRH
jgi:hypothetical protein